MFHGPPRWGGQISDGKSPKGGAILEFRDVRRWGEEPVSKIKKRGSDDRVGASARIAVTVVNSADTRNMTQVSAGKR